MRLPAQKKSDSAKGHEESFALPRSIVKVLRACAEKHGADAPSPTRDNLKYLWINVSEGSTCPSKTCRKNSRRLSAEDWLNVVDEAASLGVKYLVIAVGDSMDDHPEVWAICRWAQYTYGMSVGIHTNTKKLGKTTVEELKQLESNRTWLFVNGTAPSAFTAVKKAGIKVLRAHVTRDDHVPPCDMTEEMVFVGPEGVLYTCGLVLNNDEFRMGHVSEKPIEDFLKDSSLPHTIPEWTPRPEHGCDACPPIMVRRMSGVSNGD